MHCCFDKKYLNFNKSKKTLTIKEVVSEESFYLFPWSGYSIFSIDKVDLEEGASTLSTINDFVDGGGFFAVAVLTVGLPFN